MRLRVLQVEIEKYEESETKKNCFSRKQVTASPNRFFLRVPHPQLPNRAMKYSLKKMILCTKRATRPMTVKPKEAPKPAIKV